MPPSAKPSSAPPPQELPAPSYPAIESLLEATPAEDVRALFAPVKEGLAGLKGPKVEVGKKAQAALAHAEQLLELLVDTRERLIAEAKGAKGRK
ncbi:hypothetical protein LXT21_17240 [Myxococcus sp. K38C18041901]|uniref:hypothetical protein n=1 Tax=Myxococcus guangdongensis TaxID=2906760 RepID=UPI0020A837C5|nr:hypothetical protein [Myxococcus guangdongensis]MCP3060529.1 hypothetical protein [Myxococcus guangdongensis]